jgi:2-succinyl-6-hydroxy-2,4-cyclohexadiene-1-carboxylate synthase
LAAGGGQQAAGSRSAVHRPLPLARDLGPPDGPPALLLHGFLGRGADWDPVALRLARRCRVLAPDLPGHGRALGLPDDAYTMDGAADALAATLDAGGAARAALVGYSMGGRLALHCALRHPGRVERLVLLSASPGLRTEEERAARRRLDAERAREIQRDLDGFLDHWYRMPLFATLSEAQRSRLVRERRGNAPAELARSLAGMGTGAPPGRWEHLPEIRVPAWAVAGSKDAKFVGLARAMAEEGPFEAVVVPAAGHALVEERPLALAQLLRRLLAARPS